MLPSDDNARSRSELARDVLAAFMRNPEMVDSLEGIARFRLHEQLVGNTVYGVTRALSWLVERQFLVQEDVIGGAPLFRLNTDSDKVAEAARFLTQDPHKAATNGDPSRNANDVDRCVETNAFSDCALLYLVRRWIDATLLRHLHQQPNSEGDLPGLTRSSTTIESLLRPAVAPVSAETEVVQRSADEAWQELARELARDDASHALAAANRALKLSPAEVQTLLLCLGPELDMKYQAVYGVLNDDLSRRAATLGLVCKLLGDPIPIRNELTSSGGLTRWRLLENGPLLPYADEPLRLDTAFLAWLFGNEAGLLDDARFHELVQTLESADEPSRSSARLDGLIEWLTERATGAREWIVLCDDCVGWRSSVTVAARAAQRRVLRIPLRALLQPEEEHVTELAARLTRAVLLLDAVPVFDTNELGRNQETLNACRRVFSSLAAAGRAGMIIAEDARHVLEALPNARFQVLRGRTPSMSDLAQTVASSAQSAGLELTSEDAERIAMTFPLSRDAVDHAVRLAALERPTPDIPVEHLSALMKACRRVAAPDLPRFARRVEPELGLDHVVLPNDRCFQLAEIVSHVRCAAQVLNAWGFSTQLPYGHGVSALFYGPSGTGKTMAAQAIAYELRTEAYVVDLARVVSKYIGESEKNIDAVFTDAERAGAVLVFDEADALFGKRSEIKDAHDRYANIEVAFLLQRIEAFSGVAILTTNIRQNIDQAFLRRLRFVVEFPRPDIAAREEIWRRCVPRDAPLASDVNLKILARRLDLTGGNIRQITLRAAFAAARERNDAIEMRHVLGAALAELRKLGMPSAERELAEFEASQRQSPPAFAEVGS